jgi:methyl-accepting chemotaxis protein
MLRGKAADGPHRRVFHDPHMTLKNKFRLIVGLAVAGLLVLGGFWLSSERSRILQEKQEKARNLVETACSVVLRYHEMEKTGKLDRQEAQTRAIVALKAMRYEGDNYFWINDLHPNMVMHPTKPQLDGKDLSDVKDPAGKALFVEMADTVRREGSGFVSYMWPKPGTDKPVAKLSYVKGFEPWGWVIGTGIYIDDVEATWRKSAAIAAGLTTICFFVLLVASAGVSRSIFGRLNNMVERIKDVAQGEGDLTKRVEVGSEDEVAELAKWFNTFMDKLQEILSKVSSNAHSLAAAGEQISATSRQQAQGAEQQKDQANQVATAMQEMASTVQQVSENSNSAAAASQKAAEAAHQGGKVVEETLSRMRAIADSVGQTARKIDELGKQSDQIGRIIGVIDDIADQTNLLALNAAIEAARAGEQGRGFAVVADEVRKLAERTSSATKEITGMILSIQAETKSAVTAMQAGTNEVQLGVELTTQAGSSLHDIIQMSEQVGDMVTHIATAATEHSAATEEINNSIEQITKITAASAAGTQQTTDALQDLAALAANLQRLVGQFRLGAEDGGEAPRPGQNRSRASRVDQSVAASLDFARVKMAHRSWRLKLRGFLDGRENLDPHKLGSHQTCELGKWIYAEGMATYAQFPAFQALEEKHKAMHVLVRQVVELKHAGKAGEAEQEFTRVCDAAEDVVAYLTKLETSVTQPRAQAAAAGK